MKLIRNINNITTTKGYVATIGNYDGVHLGHKKVLARVKQQATASGLPSLVIVFEPQPMEYFLQQRANSRLTTLREKLQIFAAFGIDNVLCLRFNSTLASLTAKEFIQEILLAKLHIKSLVIGDDFSFGCNRTGGFELLQQYMQVERIATLQLNGTKISSTHVRQALVVGDFSLAAKLLGRPYIMAGKVAHGNHLGRKLGFPTANIYVHHKVLPFTGVYAVKVFYVEEKPVLGVANIGNRPTVDGVRNVLEVHILDFDKDIYGVRIQVEFLQKIRDEVKFDSIALLKQQIEQDVKAVKKNDRI